MDIRLTTEEMRPVSNVRELPCGCVVDIAEGLNRLVCECPEVGKLLSSWQAQELVKHLESR